MASITTDTLTTAEKYKYLIGCILPRPIALVSTLNTDNSVNLAPFSSLNLVASSPMTLSFSISVRPDGSKKDTQVNIERDREFVVNSTHTSMLKQTVLTGAAFPYGASELSAANLNTCPSQKVKPPGLVDSIFRLECVLETTLPIGTGQVGSATIIVGRIEMIHIADHIFEQGRIDFKKLDILSRLGGHYYAGLGEFFEEQIPEIK